MKLVLGLDLSITNTGLCLIDAATEGIVDAFAIQTEPADGPRVVRCEFISTIICEYLDNVHLIVIEDYAYSRGTALATLGELGGIVKLGLWKTTSVMECWVTVVSGEVKRYATGNWSATKDDMINVARPYFRKYGQLTDEQMDNDNIADAYWIARFGLHKFSQASGLNQTYN
jgi:hypothetical protein